MPPDDGVSEVPIVLPEEGEPEMAVDLTDNVAAELVRTGVSNHQKAMADIETNASNVHNLARLVAVRKFDELGSIESRAHSGVMATPIASPVTQSGS